MSVAQAAARGQGTPSVDPTVDPYLTTPCPHTHTHFTPPYPRPCPRGACWQGLRERRGGGMGGVLISIDWEGSREKVAW
jgi:hypothetical protein